MLNRIRFVICFFISLLVVGNVSAQVSPGLAAYVEGLGHMQSAEWKQAIASFDQALQNDSENAAYFTARGVAKTLAEDFPSAQKDFERSLRLRPNDKETRMWQAVAERLSNWYAMVETGVLYDDNCPREYSIFIFNDLVISYHAPGVADGSDKRSREKFPRAGAWFADLAFGRANVTPALYQIAKKQMEGKQYEAALRTVQRLLALSPESNDALRLEGWARLGYGDAATARASFTRVLTALTTDGDSYAGRAIARARIGDVKGAEEDLKLAKANRSQRVDEAAKAIAEAKGSPLLSRAEAVQAFRSAIEAGAGWDDLVAKALAVRRVMNNERRRYDEWYQSRVRALEAAIMEKPSNADRQIDLAQFLYDNSEVRGEQVEPRSGWRGYRYQTDATKAEEIAHAERIVDGVLEKDANFLRALGLKVRLRLYHGQNADAAQYYDRMIKLGANDVNSTIVYAEMLDAMAWQKSGEAARLRAKDGNVTFSGDWMITTYLTDEGWRQVREHEAMADQFSKLSSETLAKAAAALKGTPRGNYYQAKVFLRANNLEGARTELEKAIKGDPEMVTAYDLLASTYSRMGDAKKSFELRVAAWNRQETSAGLLLPGARQDIVGTHFKDARATLDWALTIDPADARIYTYYGVSFIEDEKKNLANNWLQGALAMEEARAKQQGTTYTDAGRDTRTIEDFGMSMAVRQRMIEAMKASGAPPADRLALARTNISYEKRIAMAEWTAPVYSAMIPSLTEEVNGPPPQVPEGIVRIALPHVSAGDALFDLQKHAEAEAEYKAVFALQAAYKEFTVDRAENNELNDVRRWAAIGLGHALLKQDKYDEALATFQSLPRTRLMQTKFNEQELAAKKLEQELQQYKESHGILTDQEQQIKELEEMNAANKRMRDEALRDREERNRALEQSRQQRMEEIRQRQKEADERRRQQMEEMRNRQRRSR
ncbi:MAG TPA: tetratricopeptide repeat protein [Candidatus Sumerlaeota bacterium]|nr:tetratricopeptide repeat protein [Candidatus Sumerlaeota bacterium]